MYQLNLAGTEYFHQQNGIDQRLDAILGRMMRELIDFEGEVDNRQTQAAMQSVVNRAIRSATEQGLDVTQVQRLASRVTVSR